MDKMVVAANGARRAALSASAWTAPQRSCLCPNPLQEPQPDALRAPPTAPFAGEVTITNDGATILQKMRVQQPAARMFVELSKSQARSSTAPGPTPRLHSFGRPLR